MPFDIALFNFLEDEFGAIVEFARDRYRQDHPSASASIGEQLPVVLAQLMDAYIDTLVTGQLGDALDDLWENSLAGLDIAPSAMLDLLLGLIRASCNRLVELGVSDIEPKFHWLDRQGVLLVGRLVERCRAVLLAAEHIGCSG
jgi:hypothetical protein